MQRNFIECSVCKRLISKSNYNKHLCESKNPYKKVESIGGFYDCKCGRKFEKIESLRAHHGHCGKPKRKLIGWCKGLTKYNNESVNKHAETLLRKLKSGEIKPSYLGKNHTTETKRKLSDIAKNQFITGKRNSNGTTKCKWVEIETSNGKLKVQGSYEVRTCRILDILKENGEILDWEYTNDRIQYIGPDNKQHTYLIDFKVINTDGTFHYLEVKGRKMENDEFKWKAVRELGYRLDVWFIEDIKKFEK
jgi:hypothetical protein